MANAAIATVTSNIVSILFVLFVMIISNLPRKRQKQDFDRARSGFDFAYII
jgi:Na+-driven multidrug efflux pump